MSAVRTSVKVTASALGVLCALVLLELGLRVAKALGEGEPLAERIYRTDYRPAERDRTTPLHTTANAAQCVEYRERRLHWHNWFGFNAKRLDKSCARRFLASRPLGVVLLGGSAMENMEAPNYLTHIDYLAFGEDDRIALLNLAESGARHANMLARFVHEVIELEPDVVVFMDGANEFNSVRYGGAPGDDFYYTAGVRQRIENPARVLLDKAVEKSALVQAALVGTGLVQSPRAPQSLRVEPSAAPDAAIFLRQRALTQALCERHRIACIFVLQPIAFTTSPGNANTEAVLAAHRKVLPHDERLYREGYALVRDSAEWQSCRSCYDASNLFAGVENAFFDFVHFSANGGRKLGPYLRERVLAVAPAPPR